MKQALLSALNNQAMETLKRCAEQGETVALTGLAEGQAAFVASKMAAEGLSVLLVRANELRANAAAGDAAQLLGGLAAAMPAGQVDLTRGASSHESAWKRLETLIRIAGGEVRLLSVSAEALMQRMGPPDPIRQALRTLRVGDAFSPEQLIRLLVRLGYERVAMVEGKGQCALRGAILDFFAPNAAQGIRIEYFDDEIDAIRSFDVISQRSSDRLEEALIVPASEVLLPPEQAERAAASMRQALEQLSGARPHGDLLPELPPLPGDEDDPPEAANPAAVQRAAEMDHRLAALLGEAQLVEEGLPPRRARAWLPLLTEEYWLLTDWFRPQLVLLSEPELIRERCSDRRRGFAGELSTAMERGEAVSQQDGLLLDWDSLLRRLSGFSLATASDLTRGLAGVKPGTVLKLDSMALSGYNSQVRHLAEDVSRWLDEGLTVALLSGGVARASVCRPRWPSWAWTCAFMKRSTACRRAG